MYKLLMALLIVTTSLLGNMYDLKPVKITDSITCFIGDYNPPMKSNKGFVSNVCYVDMGDDVVVIEAGPTYKFAQELNEIIQKDLGKKVSYVIVTNFHDDRYTGASFYKEKNIPIIAHKTIVKELEENPDKFNRIPRVTTEDEYAKSKVVQPDILTDDKYIIKSKNRTLEVLKLSAGSNSVSDISVYSPKDDFIFTGNTVFNGRFIKYGKYSNINFWIEALEKLEKMNIKYILGGHGSQYDKNSYKNNLEYLRLLKKNVKNAFEEDIEVYDIENSFDFKIDRFKHINHFKNLHKNNINKYYEELEFTE